MTINMKSTPSFDYERTFWNKGLKLVAGVDEVGRGAFAGPVVAAAVILPQISFPHCEEINDSKLLTAKKRETLSNIIQTYALTYAIAEISVEIINKIGVGKATFQAMRQALSRLTKQPDHILIDGFYIPDIEKSQQTPIVKGDQKSYSIAAASIIAKVYRDKIMDHLSETYDNYFFAQNKGYGTTQHRQALQKFGLCQEHRQSFDLEKYLP